MASDGTISIKIDVDGKEVDVASKSLDNLESAGHKGGKGVKATEDGLKDVGKESSKATGNVKKFATSLGLIAIGATAFAVLKSSMDAAISRFDTMNNFPKVLQALGVSAEDSEKSVSRLSDGIDGLPTKLDDIASTAQRMYTSFGDMDKATESALALNNSLLGSGSSAEQASRGTEQYLKVLQTGQMDLMTWRSLSETMDVGLVKIAEGFEFAGASAKDDLYNALKDGTITLDQFNDKLIEVGTGTGIMAELARENTQGIANSLGNLRYAFARGITNILESLDKLSVAVTGNTVAENLDGMKHIIMAAFGVIQRVIEGSIPVIKMFAAGISVTMSVVKALTPMIAGLVAAYTSLFVINRAVAMFGALTGAMNLATIATTAKTVAVTLLGNAMKFLSGPVGWVSAGLGAVVAGSIAVVKWFKRSSKEAKRLNKETEELGDSTDELNDSIEDSQKAYKDSQKEIRASSKANEELASKIQELASIENKSASEKALLKSYTEQLNDSVDDLNLSYDEESDSLNMSNDHLQARLDLFKEQETAQEAQNRLVEVLKEQNEVEEQLAETNELREEWNEKLEDGSVKSREHKKAIAELDEQEQLLKDTIIELGNEQEITEEQIEASMEAIAEATQSSVDSQMLAFDELSESQQATIEDMKATWEDYKDAATDMFDVLSDEIELSVDEMTENLEENQRIIGEWSEGIAELAERGVNEGLLDKLREAGPESAGHVNALVNASDEELEKLSETFAKGGDAATDALSKSLGIDETEILEAIGHLVIDTEESLRESVDSADFEGIGGMVADGFSEGIEDDIPKAEGAMEKMADASVDEFKSGMKIESPSKVFKEFGSDITDGLDLGISEGTDTVIKTVEKLVKSTIGKFADFQSDFKSIGSNAMSGLNTGLNAGRQRVLNTARSIANSVAHTMKTALDIRSPSRIMKDEVGAMIPEGITLGIEDNASSVFSAIDSMTRKMVDITSPDIAFGRIMSYSGRLGNSISNTSTNNVQNSNQTVNMEGMFNGANFNVRDEQDIENLARRIYEYKKSGARRVGVKTI